MFLIDKNSNEIRQISERKFSDLGFKERDHLQEWIAKLPSSLGEDLIIIQKEFDGFDDTSERLDLLALDKEGNLVVIENKLDDSGKNVVWQAMKYAAYCSTLTKGQIVDIYQKYLNSQRVTDDAKERLIEFFGVVDLDEIELNKPQSQRIFFIAANFRKEVTATALYLMDYNFKIKCFKVTPYQKGDELFLDINQILPMKDSEDYIIRMAEKNQESLVMRDKLRERHKVNQQFWSEFLDAIASKSSIYDNINPSKDGWLWKSAGISGLGYCVVISKTYARVEFAINTVNQETNKKLFDYLFSIKKDVESGVGKKLEWERINDKRVSRIKYELNGVNVNNEDDWSQMIDFLVENVILFEKYFNAQIPKLRQLINTDLSTQI